MPDALRRIFSLSTKDIAPVNSYEGFQSNGAVVLRDRRGTTKAEIPDVDLKSEGFGSDPLAIYKPTGAKSVSPAKAMANFNGWTFAAVNAIASEVANIQFRLYQVNGDDHDEQDDHPLLTLLDGVNERNRWRRCTPTSATCSVGSLEIASETFAANRTISRGQFIVCAVAALGRPRVTAPALFRCLR